MSEMTGTEVLVQSLYTSFVLTKSYFYSVGLPWNVLLQSEDGTNPPLITRLVVCSLTSRAATLASVLDARGPRHRGIHPYPYYTAVVCSLTTELPLLLPSWTQEGRVIVM